MAQLVCLDRGSPRDTVEPPAVRPPANQRKTEVGLSVPIGGRRAELRTGEDILAALRTAPALAEREDAPTPPAANRGNRTRRRGGAVVDYPGSKLDAYRRTLKEGRP
jgi:hypothetical protein